MSTKEALEQAIAQLEAQRGVLGDTVVDTSQAALRKQLSDLIESERLPHLRKQATVMFMDIANHTALTRDLDPEEQLEMIDNALARLSEPVIRFGGHIVRYQGDGFKAVFGLAETGEYDPDRAIQAALDIQAAARSIAVTWEQEKDLPGFKVRVGIDTGIVIVGGIIEGQDSVSGLTVNLAARLENLADPGAILISQHTYQHVRGVFDLEPLRPILVKGFDKPVPIYRVLRTKPRSFRTRRRGVEGIDTQMIGREKEFSLLQGTYQRAVTEKKQQWVSIIGDAGIGKSRLLYEFESWVDLQPEALTLFRGRARQETQPITYGLLRDIFAFRFAIRDDDPLKMMRQKFIAGFAEWLPPGDETVMKAEFVGQLLGYDFTNSPAIQEVMADPKQLHNRALVYMNDYFKAVAAEPIIVLIEDLHWGDESSLDILTYLSRAQRNKPALFLTTARPEIFSRRPDWMVDHPDHQWIKLAPLSMAESRLLVGEVLQKMAEIPSLLEDLVIANAEGNPFFVEELIKMLIDDGIILKSDDIWSLVTDKIKTINLPTTMTTLMQTRLDGLPDQERTILQQASVVGRTFWDQLVIYFNKKGAGSIGEEEIVSGLSSLLKKEMIYYQDQSTFAGSIEHIFKHAILREVTYESVLLRSRRTYHTLVAEWLTAQSRERPREYTGLIAYHFEQAGMNSQALYYLQLAGEEAAAAYANSEALNYYQRALEICPKDETDSRYELLVKRMKLNSLLGRRQEEKEDLEIVGELAAQLDDISKLSFVSYRWSIYHAYVGDNSASISAAKKSVALAGKAGNEILKARGYLVWGRALWRKGRFKKAWKRFNQALPLAEKTNDLWLVANLYLNLGNVADDLGDTSIARDYYEKSLGIDRQRGDRLAEGISLNNLGIISAQSGNLTEAQHYFEQSLQNARLTGNSAGEGLALGNLGNVTADLGDFERSKYYFEQYLENTKSITNRQGQGYALNGLGYALYGLGQFAEAAEAYKEAVELRQELDQQHLIVGSRAGWAQAVLALGRQREAFDLIHPILALLDSEQISIMAESILTLLICVKVLQANEDPRAQTILEKAYRAVQKQAEEISNPDDRRLFIENVPWHRAIIEMWHETQSANSPAESGI